MNDLVSVIVPAYNAERTLAECLDSILCQTYQNIEVIIIDDGSTDATTNFLREYVARDHRVRYYSQPNGGVAAARNSGLRRARGRFVTSIDADDIWLNDKLERQLRRFYEHPGNIVLAQVRRFTMRDGTRTYLATTPLPEFVTRRTYLETLLNLSSFQMALFSTALIPRDCLDNVGLYDERLTVAEDWDLWIRLAEKYDFSNIQQPLYLYRKHSQSLTMQAKLNNILTAQLNIIEKVRLRSTASPKVIRKAKTDKYLEFANFFLYQQDYASALKTLVRGSRAAPLYLRLDLYRLLYGLAKSWGSRITTPNSAV